MARHHDMCLLIRRLMLILDMNLLDYWKVDIMAVKRLRHEAAINQAATGENFED